MAHVAENQKSCSTRRSFDIGTYDVHRGETMALVRHLLFVPIVIGRIIVSKMLKMGGAARVVSLFSA